MHRVADHRELRMTFVSNGAGDRHAGVDADAETDRVDQRMRQCAVEAVDSGGDCGAGGDRLPAGDVGLVVHPEQGQQPVAQNLVGLAAGAQYCCAHGVEKLVDDEHGVERQAPLGQPARTAHVDKHDDDITLDPRRGRLGSTGVDCRRVVG